MSSSSNPKSKREKQREEQRETEEIISLLKIVVQKDRENDQAEELKRLLEALFDIRSCQRMFWSFECCHTETVMWRYCKALGRTEHKCFMTGLVPMNMHIPIRKKCPDCGGPSQDSYVGQPMNVYIWIPYCFAIIARLEVSLECGVGLTRGFKYWAASLGEGIPATVKHDPSDKNIGFYRCKFVEREYRDSIRVQLSTGQVSNTISFDGRNSTKL